MAHSIEVEAKTIQEAIEEAANKLGVSPEKLEVEILDVAGEKSLGVNGRNARIRATVKQEHGESRVKGESDTPGNKWKEGVEPEFEIPKRSYTIDADSKKIPDGVELARKVLEDLCRFIEPDLNVLIIPTKDYYRLCIPAKGSGIFIGKNGTTLEALQYIINRIMSQRGYTDLKIVVDSEDYRLRKNKQLEETVKKLANKARETGKIQYTEPLNAFDRRVVHLVLKDEKGIEARSVGVGDKRKIQIKPIKTRSQSQGGRTEQRKGYEKPNSSS